VIPCRSLTVAVQNRASASGRKPPVQRRLIIRTGAIGDVIVSLPALEYLRTGYTEVWAPADVVPLIRFADRVRAISSTSLDLLELGRAPESLTEALASFNDIVSWYGANRPEFAEAVRGFPFRFFPALPPASRHATDFYLAQVGAPGGASPRIPCPPQPRTHLALHPYSGSPAKNWPLENFQALARLEPFEWCQDRFDDLGELAGWLSGARLFVGNDSGITHLAAAVGTPTLALFGPTDPAVWAPRGAHVIRQHRIEAITVDQVHRAVIDLLK
jgi:heptosyltransferase III